MLERFSTTSAAIAGICAAVMAAAPRVVVAQDGAAPRISWVPERPVQGTLFRIRVTSLGPDARVSGTIGEEPLHFAPTAAGWEALAAAPLDKGAHVEARITTEEGARADTMVAQVPVAKGTYKLEQLTVAPRFGGRPDSALQARMDRERKRALEVSRAAHATPRLWKEVRRPRDTRITSAFGSGREFNGTVQSRHTGTDLAGAVGAPVRAAARGIVALVDTFYLAGRVIYLDHGAGLVSAYFHLSRQDVAVGDTVRAGQQIGLVGATGRVTGPHLHWVVRYGAVSVDPLSLLAVAAAQPTSSRTELDHAFIVVDAGATREISALRSAGITVSNRIAHHDGQGTASVAAMFENAYLELIWLDSAVSIDAEHAGLARKFRHAAAWRTSGYSPFGFGLRRLPADSAPLPVPVRREPAPWLGADAAYELLLQAADSLAADLFVVPARAALPNWIDRVRQRAPQELRHASGARAITSVRVYGPPQHMPAALAALRPARLEARVVREPLLEVELDGGATGRRIDMRPVLPLVVVR